MRLPLAFGAALVLSAGTAFAGSVETAPARSAEISAFAAAALGAQPAPAADLGATRSVARAYAPMPVERNEFGLVMKQYQLRAAETRTVDVQGTDTQTTASTSAGPAPVSAPVETAAVAPGEPTGAVTAVAPQRKVVTAPKAAPVVAAAPRKPIATRVALETPGVVESPRRKISFKNYFMIGVVR